MKTCNSLFITPACTIAQIWSWHRPPSRDDTPACAIAHRGNQNRCPSSDDMSSFIIAQIRNHGMDKENTVLDYRYV